MSDLCLSSHWKQPHWHAVASLRHQTGSCGFGPGGAWKPGAAILAQGCWPSRLPEPNCTGPELQPSLGHQQQHGIAAVSAHGKFKGEKKKPSTSYAMLLKMRQKQQVVLHSSWDKVCSMLGQQKQCWSLNMTQVTQHCNALGSAKSNQCMHCYEAARSWITLSIRLGRHESAVNIHARHPSVVIVS